MGAPKLQTPREVPESVEAESPYGRTSYVSTGTRRVELEEFVDDLSAGYLQVRRALRRLKARSLWRLRRLFTMIRLLFGGPDLYHDFRLRMSHYVLSITSATNEADALSP